MIQPLSAPNFSGNSFTASSEKVPKKSVTLLPDHRNHLLLISESPQTVQTIRQSLGMDLRLSTAQSLEDGISSISHDCPDIIICDLTQGIKDLIECVAHAEFCKIPLLVIEDDRSAISTSSLIALGVTDIIDRPLNFDLLKNRVQGYLDAFLARKILKSEIDNREASTSFLAKECIAKLNELSRVNRMKDEFMAMLSHELRNPINVISGFAEILISNLEDSELVHEAAQAIHRNAQFQAKLVQDLLDISRSMNGKLILDCKPLDLESILREIVSSAQKSAEPKQVELNLDVNTPGLIYGDAARISQVVWNLISNAVKFTPENGKVHVELNSRGPWVEISVQDTGVGIDPDFLPHIFEQFHQQNTTITKNFGGLGLGLAIVKHIVGLHGGSVHATSDGVGHGATFTVRLPSLPN